MLNYNDLLNSFGCLQIGKLTKARIAQLSLSISACDIVIWDDKISYFEKHKSEYSDLNSYKRSIESLPEIIAAPDYIAIHPTKNSIEFIKKLDDIVLVAVRIRTGARLAVRTMFPIAQAKLNEYISSGTAIKIVD